MQTDLDRCADWLRIAGVLLALLFAGATAAADEWVYTVQPGDNPWSLSERFLIDMRYWPRLQRHNRIVDPTHIPPGTTLRIPRDWLREQAATANVLALQGNARRLPGDTAVDVGASLTEGEHLLVADASNVTLGFVDGSQVLVQADSELQLQTLRGYQNTKLATTELVLVHGRVENKVDGESGGTRFEITTPALTTAVRGTEFRVGAQADSAQAEVLQGRVAAANDSGDTALAAGFGTSAAAGAAPAPPVVLLPAPDVSGQPTLIEQLPVSLELPSLDGAEGYRLQIAETAEFSTLLYDEVETSVRLHGPDLPDGQYFVRVRGIDPQRIEGQDADFSFRINARPEPPFLSAPAADAALAASRPSFDWSARPDLRYHFQLARSEDFADPLVDRDDLVDARWQADIDLEPGIWFWRVSAIDPAEGPGPFGDAQQLRRLPPGPALEPPSLDADGLTLRWRGGSDGQRYAYQFGRDADFDSVVAEGETDQPSFSLDRPDWGTYYLRVRTIDVDGYAGPYGDPQSIEIPQPKYLWTVMLPVFLMALLL